MFLCASSSASDFFFSQHPPPGSEIPTVTESTLPLNSTSLPLSSSSSSSSASCELYCLLREGLDVCANRRKGGKIMRQTEIAEERIIEWRRKGKFWVTDLNHNISWCLLSLFL